MPEWKETPWGSLLDGIDAAMDLDRRGPAVDPFLLDLAINRRSDSDR